MYEGEIRTSIFRSGYWSKVLREAVPSAALYCLDQDGLVERFEQVVCGPEVANSLSVAGFVVAGDDNDRDCDVHGRHRLQHIESRCLGHVKIEQHAVWPLRLDSSQKIIARLKRLNVIAMSSEQTPQRQAHLCLIIQDSDDFFAICHSALSIARRATFRQLYLG